jgi:hypothetical protein
MPFTGAHPLAIAPLLYSRGRIRALDATALVLGSMAPDFEYFAHAQESGAFGHTLPGLVAWCLPVSLALALAWHHVVKWPLVLASPHGIARRVAPRAAGRWRLRPVAFGVSALIGAASHDVWDAFTHADGFVVRRVPELRTPIDVPILGHTVVHRLLQHGCSVVGLAAVAIVVGRAIRRWPPIELPARPAWKARGVLVALVGVGVAATVARVIRMHNIDAGDLVVATISGGLAGVTIASLILRRDALAVRSVSGGRDTNGAWHA